MKTPVRYDHQTKISVTEDYRTGAYSYRELSDKYGIAVSTIRQWVLKAGITPSKKKYRNGEKKPVQAKTSAANSEPLASSAPTAAGHLASSANLSSLSQPQLEEVSRMKALERRKIQLEIELSTLRSLL